MRKGDGRTDAVRGTSVRVCGVATEGGDALAGGVDDALALDGEHLTTVPVRRQRHHTDDGDGTAGDDEHREDEDDHGTRVTHVAGVVQTGASGRSETSPPRDRTV